MIFNAEQMEVVDASGTPCGYRVEWTEARVFTERVLDWFAKTFLALSFFAVMAALFLLGASRADAWQLPLFGAVVLFGIGWGFARTSARLPGKVSWMEFYQDGRLTASWDPVIWDMRIDHIRNIESEQLKQKKSDDDCPYTHGVRIVTRRGRVVRVANSIEPDDAITLAVLLSESIEDLRFPQITASINGKEMAVW